jgi:hypothetical protein
MLMEPALSFVLLLTLVGCGTRGGDPGAALSADALGAAALRTHADYTRSHSAREIPLSPEIPRAYWAQEIEALRPLRVYLHRVNVVVVQKESDGLEEGKYITTIISSYAPQSGDDGFTFTNPDRCVYDFKRVKP